MFRNELEFSGIKCRVITKGAGGSQTREMLECDPWIAKAEPSVESIWE